MPLHHHRHARRSDALVLVFAGVVLASLVAGCAPVQRAPEPATATTEHSQETREPDDPASALHFVRPGQTAWRIARAYGISLDTLAEANGLSDPTRIDVGDVLQIPGARAPIDVAPYPAPLDAVGSTASIAHATPFDAGELAWPVDGGRIVSGYGVPRGRRRHSGIDIDGERGDPVRAAASGVVLYSGSTMRGYGKTVIVDHGKGVTTLYAHNSTLTVGKGARVERGQRIARIGQTGNATGTHLHFEVRVDDVPVDPTGLLGGRLAENRR